MRRAPAAATVGVILLAAGLVLALDRQSLWTDEATTGLLMRSSLDRLIVRLATSPGSESAQPLYYLLLWPWTRAVGDAEAALRLPSVIFSLLTALVLRDILRLLGLSEAVATVGSASFFALPVVIWYSLEARPYALVMLCCTLHLREALRRVRASPADLGRLPLLTLATALAFSVAGAAALLSCGVVAARTRRGGGAPASLQQALVLRASTGALVALALAAFVVLWSLLRAGNPNVPVGRGGLESTGYALYEVVLGRSVGFSVAELRRAAGIEGLLKLIAADPDRFLIIAALAVGFGGIVLVGARAIHPRRDAAALAVTLPWLATALSFCLYATATGFPLLGRHLLFALPAFVVVLVLGLSRASPRSGLLAGLFVFTAGALAFTGLALDGRYAKEDFRSVARLVSACRLDPAEVAYVTYSPGFEYYAVAGTRASLHDGVAFLRAKIGRPAVLVVDTSRFDQQETLDDELRQAPSLYRLSLPSLTVYSTVPLDGCDASE